MHVLVYACMYVHMSVHAAYTYLCMYVCMYMGHICMCHWIDFHSVVYGSCFKKMLFFSFLCILRY